MKSNDDDIMIRNNNVRTTTVMIDRQGGMIGVVVTCHQWRQREFKVGRDEPCEPTVLLPD